MANRLTLLFWRLFELLKSRENCDWFQAMPIIGIDKRQGNRAVLCDHITSRNGKFPRLTPIDFGEIKTHSSPDGLDF